MMKFLLLTIGSIVSLSLSASADPANIKEWVELDEGKSAHELRGSGKTYLRKVEYALPEPATTLKRLNAINPHISTLLPGLGALMESAKVSPYYAQLYAQKIKQLRSGIFPTTHNFYDCETVLELESPQTHRKVLLVQADMDVVTDGTDPTRKPALTDYDSARVSNSFLPFTKYGWPKNSSTPANPFINYYPAALKELQEVRADLAKRAEEDKGMIWRELLETCDAQIRYVKGRGNGTNFQKWTRERRYVLATEDPFIVLPNGWFNTGGDWKPRPGDIAAVVYRNKIYPAILGDSGPETITGEASLRLARKLNPEASGRQRAVDGLGVTYLLFPNCRIESGNLDMDHWRNRVLELLDEIGGVSSADSVHKWE